MKASTVDIVRNNATLKQWVNDSNLSEHQKLVINESIGQLTHFQIKDKSYKPIINKDGIRFCGNCKGSLWQNSEAKYCFRCGARVGY